MPPQLKAQPNPKTRKPVTVRAVHPNEGVRRWYQTELLALITEMHLSVSRHVLAAYAEHEPAEIASDARTKNPSILIRRALEKWGGIWIRKLDKLSTTLSRKFASRAFAVSQTQLKAAFKDAGFTVAFQPTPGSVAAYQAVAAEQVNLIKSIPQQYLKDVQSKVWQSVMHGGDLHELSLGLQETYGVTADRAALIARDQNAKAKAVIERTRREEMGITHAIWMHSSGGKVPRATHVAMDGKPYRIAQGMYDSAEGKYVLPGELINCRCVSKAVIPAFDDVATARARALANRPTELFNAARLRAK